MWHVENGITKRLYKNIVYGGKKNPKGDDDWACAMNVTRWLLHISSTKLPKIHRNVDW